MTADAVLFDLDGCLVDSRIAFARGINAALTEAGLAEREERELYSALGPPLHTIFRRLCPTEEHLLGSLVAAYRRRYITHGISETRVYAGMRDVVAELATRMPLVVATSKPEPLAKALLQALDFDRPFQAIVGSSLTAVDEPKTVTVRRAVACLANCRSPVMVGDRRFDIEAANALGLTSVGVLWGSGSREELSVAGAHRLARTTDELLTILTSL